MNLNGVELNEREAKSLMAAIEESTYHWAYNERCAITDEFRRRACGRLLDLQRIAKLLTEATECTRAE